MTKRVNARIIKKKDTEPKITLRNDFGKIQWRYNNLEWQTLFETEEIRGKQGFKGDKGDKGDKGEKGEQGIRGVAGKDGIDGKQGNAGKDGRDGKDGKDGKDAHEIQLRKSNTHIQWKRTNQDSWVNLVSLEDLRGPEGSTYYGSGGGGSGDVQPGTLDHTELINIGVNTHAEIDVHIADLTNPHQTSDANLVVTDVTTNNVSTSAHGFAPKLSGSASQFLAGDGTYKVPSGTANAYTSQAFSSQTSVNVTHNFGAYPQVQVLDGSGNVLIPETIVHNSVNDFTVTFAASTSGTILANLGSPQANNYTATGISYTLTGDDFLVNATTGGITLTLPTAVGAEARRYVIKNTSVGNVTVDTTSSQTIDDQLTAILKPYESLSVFSDGSNWHIY